MEVIQFNLMIAILAQNSNLINLEVPCGCKLKIIKCTTIRIIFKQYFGETV